MGWGRPKAMVGQDLLGNFRLLNERSLQSCQKEENRKITLDGRSSISEPGSLSTLFYTLSFRLLP
jgi:hypothetical protein